MDHFDETLQKLKDQLVIAKRHTNQNEVVLKTMEENYKLFEIFIEYIECSIDFVRKDGQ